MLEIGKIARQGDDADQREDRPTGDRKGQRAAATFLPPREVEPHPQKHGKKRHGLEQLWWMPDARAESVARLPPALGEHGREIGDGAPQHEPDAERSAQSEERNACPPRARAIDDHRRGCQRGAKDCRIIGQVRRGPHEIDPDGDFPREIPEQRKRDGDSGEHQQPREGRRRLMLLERDVGHGNLPSVLWNEAPAQDANVSSLIQLSCRLKLRARAVAAHFESQLRKPQ
jgi:hypothetical protein